jgi:hypothetical protein
MRYGWSAKQLERVNARRARRGQKPLGYSKEYSRRRKSIEEEDEDPQIVSEKEVDENLGKAETPRLEKLKEKQKTNISAETPRLDEYKKRLRQRELEKSRKMFSSPYGFAFGGLS